MSRLLIVLGLAILLLIPPSYSSEEEEEINEEKKKRDADEYEEGCTKAKYVKTDGVEKKCTDHTDCYDSREPEDWCRLKENQSWTDKGCFCDSKKHKCIIERKNNGKMEYTDCKLAEGWNCP